MLQGVVVALPEQIKPAQSPRRHGDIGMEFATEIDRRQPGRPVVRPLIKMVVATAKEDVDQVGPSGNRCRCALQVAAKPLELTPAKSVPPFVVQRVVAASDEDIQPILSP